MSDESLCAASVDEPPLVQLLRRAGQGAVDARELALARSSFVAQMQETEASLSRLISMLSPTAAARCVDAQARAQRALATLRGAAMRSVQPDVLKDCIARADQAVRALNDIALVALGPSAFGGVNLIAYVLEHLAAGCMVHIPLAAVVSNEINSVRAALAQAADDATAPALTGLLNVLEALGRGAGEENAAALLTAWRDALLDAAGALELAVRDRGTSRIDALLRALKRYGAAAGSLEDVPALRADLAALYNSLEVARAQGGSHEAHDLAESVSDLLVGCDELLEALEQGQDVTDALTVALEQLKASHQAIERRATVEGTSTCVRCGTRNSADRRRCASCGTILPPLESAAIGTSVTSPRLPRRAAQARFKPAV